MVSRCDFTTGDSVEGKYTIEKVLGEGSFGKVYRVTDSRGMVYALKLLRLWDVHPDIRKPLMERFDMEFKTGQIDCNYLVRSLDYGVVEGNPFIVMEYCPGGDLTPYLGTRKGDVALISQQILLGLHALHTHGKVHRDLKPENVLFKKGGEAALTDFGIAGDRNKRMTERNLFGRPQQLFGTYAYMPPEQVNRARGEATVLPTTDIFSFGVLAYQLLTGQLPFGKLDGISDLAEYQKNGKNHKWNQSLLRTVPHADKWTDLIHRCLEPNFKYRISSAKDVIRVLPESNESIVQPECISSRNVGGYSLHVMQGEEYGKIYMLDSLQRRLQKAVIRMGRSGDNDIVVKEELDSYISRHHCTLETEQQGTAWYIRDGQWNAQTQTWNLSSNGTYVNSTQVDKTGWQLTVGDIITIGDTKLRFENQ